MRNFSFKFNKALETFWLDYTRDNGTPNISEKDNLKDFFDGNNGNNFKNVILNSLPDTLTQNFFVVKFPRFTDGDSDYLSVEENKSPYIEIREKFYKDINFSTLIQLNEKKDIPLTNNFAFYVYDDETELELVNNLDIIIIPYSSIYEKLHKIETIIQEWKDKIINNLDYDKADIESRLNEEIRSEDNRERIIENIQIILESKYINNSELAKQILKSNFFYEDNDSEKEFDFLKLFIFFIKMSLSRNEIAIFKTSPVYFKDLEGAITLIWSINLKNINRNFLENLFLCSNAIISSLDRIFVFSLYESFLKSQIKSAIAAIMSRNMSHNIGSHILAYLKYRLSSISAIFQNNVLSKFITIDQEHFIDQNENIQKNFSHGKTHQLLVNQHKSRDEDINYDTWIEKILDEVEDKIELPFLLGLGRFINYLQERQDYIATIASDYIPYFATVNFKNTIYDELLYDYKIKRHKNLSNYSTENIILDNIARSEGYSRDNIHIYFRNFNGIDTESHDLKILRTIELDMPGGIMGRQALFSIFENIIRNAAKHGTREEGKDNLILIIDYDDKKYDEFVEITITDNNIVPNEQLDLILKGLKENYIDNLTGRLVETNKGIKEIRISTAWLNGQSVAEINEQNLTPKILDATNNNWFLTKEDLDKVKDELKLSNEDSDKLHEIIHKVYTDKNAFIEKLKKVLKIEEENENRYDLDKLAELCFHQYLTYKFYLRKPQRCAVISKNAEHFMFEKGKGWEVYTRDEYLVNTNKSYNLVIIDENYSDKEQQEIKQASPARTIAGIYLENHPLKIDSFENQRKVYEKKYKEWICNNFDFNEDELPIIAVIDPKVRIDKTQKISKHINYYSSDSDFFENSKNEIILYRTHNDTIKEFKTFEKNKQLYNRITFLEGISGHNSTDRLLRREFPTNEWAFKIIESALTKILIIDERIWITSNKVKETSNLKRKVNVEEIITKLQNNFQNESLSFEKKVVESKKIISELNNSNVLDDLIEELSFDFEEEMFAKIDKAIRALPNERTIINSNYKNIFNKKNIFIFNVIKIANRMFELVDLDNSLLGVFYKKNNKLEFDFNENFNRNYNFVSIHQGLLDKFYDTYKPSISEKEIYNKLTEIFVAKNKNIVHSGRARPHNMPEVAGFIQYSALENSIKDCKFTLTELMYSARTEKTL